MNAVPWRPTGLPVQVETLDEHRVVAKAMDPNVTLPPTLQLDPPPDVEPAGKKSRRRRSSISEEMGEGDGRRRQRQVTWRGG